jgi:hypothetical protein
MGKPMDEHGTLKMRLFMLRRKYISYSLGKEGLLGLWTPN